MTELHRLYARAGWPSTRDLARGQSFSHTTVHAMFTRPALPNWTVLCPVVERMARLAPLTDVEQCLKKFDRLWDEAERFDGLEPPFLFPGEPDDPGPGPDSRGGAGDRPPTLRPGPGTAAEPTLPDRGDSRAVIVGASSYANLPPLPSVQTGAVDLSSVLTEPVDAPFRADRTTLVIDPADPTQVLSAIDSASKDCGDTLLVYFAGHGLVTQHGDFVLATADTDQDRDYTGIRYDSIRRIVATSPAQRTLIVLDCCFSGRALDGMMGPLTGLTDAPSTYVLTSAGANRVAFAPPGQLYTAFTGSLIDILRHGVDGGTRLLDIELIHHELQARARLLALPIPELRARPGTRPLALASNAAYRAADAAPDLVVSGSRAKVIRRGADAKDTIHEHAALVDIHNAAREGRLAAYVAQHSDTANPVLYQFVAEIVFERLTRRVEQGRGHHQCAVGAAFLLPECRDQYQDDVEAALLDLLRHADRRIENLGGWIASRLNAVTVDANRKRRGLRGAQQRPRLPLWLRDALGRDPWLQDLAMDILTWVGVPTVAPGGLWPLGVWADRRAAATGDPGVTEQQVAIDVERVLTAMKKNPSWYEQFVERPLGYKQAPLMSTAHNAGGRYQQLGLLLGAGPDEASDSWLQELAAELIDITRAALLAGEDPGTATERALDLAFNARRADQLGHTDAAWANVSENLARLLADPGTRERIAQVLLALIAEEPNSGAGDTSGDEE